MRLFVLFFASLAFYCNTLSAQVSVLTQHNNNTRSGWNNRETKLNTTNVNQTQFGAAFTLPVDDQVYAQPLVVAGLPGGGKTHNVVYIATVNNSVYAYDADNGTLYWHKNYTLAGQRAPKNTDMTGACGGFYRDFSGNIGIVGTPVIDSAANTMYFVARSTANNVFVQYLHAVNIIDGTERQGSPVQITASYFGNGEGNVNGVVTFDPQRNNQRQALTLSKGIVYVTFSSHCDWQPYHGWILGYDENTLSQKIVYNATPNGYEAGIWEAGGGPAVDDKGNLLIVTGNGSVGYNGNLADPINRGESAIELTPTDTTLKVASYFTPTNYQALENSDLDYGCMGSFLIPNSNYYFTGCKDGNLYLLNKDNMGGYSAAGNNVQQTINLGGGKTLRCQPTYFKGTSSEFVYVWSENDQLKAFPFNRSTNTLNVGSVVTASANGPTGSNGANLSVSSNGSADGSGIIWAAYASNGDANQSVRPGILRAFDANNVSNELWNNEVNPTRDNAGNFAKFASPTIANGHVYLPTFSNQVVVYGIIDTIAPPVCSGVNLALNKAGYASSEEQAGYEPSKAFDGDGTTRWSSAFSDPQWIYVDLGQIDSICRVKLTWEVALGKDFLIQVSNDAQTWTTAATITGNTSFTNFIDIVAKGRYVRMYGTARGTPYGYSLYEFAVNGKVLSGCTKPDSLSFSNLTSNSVTLKWAKTGALSYNLQYRLLTSNQFKTINTTADSVTLTGLGCATNYTWQVQGVCDNAPSQFSSLGSFTTSACVGCGLLPTRVFTADIGNVNLPGEACYTGVTSYNVKGSGNDINANADQFRYVFKTFASDGTMQAKVTSQDGVNASDKAGVMFRESADSTSRNVFLGLTSGNGAVLQTRQSPGAATLTANVPNLKAPYFLKLVKHGSVYTAYCSPDSISWTQYFSTVDSMNTNGPISGGIAVTSHDNSQLSTVQFDQVGFYSYGGAEVNIALHKPSYGSNYSDLSHTGYYGNDGDSTTRWVSATGTGAQWYYVDLGQPFKLNRVDIKWDSDYANDYQLQTSNDALNWNTVQQLTANTIQSNTLMLNTSARFLRIYATKSATGNGYSIDEMQVFGDTIANNIPDIAKGKPVTSSSDESSTMTAKNAVDGDFTTRWASTTQADPQWLYVDLGVPYLISNVNITWELDVAKNFDIQLSNDANTWSTIKSITNNTAYANFIPVQGSGRYLRIYGTSRGGANYSIFDLQVLGTKDTTHTTQPGAKLNIDKFSVYPNPTKGQFSIDFESLVSQNIQVTISDETGKVLKKMALTDFSGTYHNAASLAGTAGGTYIVSLRTTKGVISKVIIKL